MPRQIARVKNNPHLSQQSCLTTPGAVDLHFHGALGIDLVHATPKSLRELEFNLIKHGVSAYAPTLLSLDKAQLKQAVSLLGRYIRNRMDIQKNPSPQAFPLGIHLEGPYLDPQTKGAHAESVLRPVNLNELEELWNLSQHTLKILTLSPKQIKSQTKSKKDLKTWAKKRNIRLSLGHSQANFTESQTAFSHLGFQAITHAWNALPFHHRSPGAIGAALYFPDLFVELICDQIHVHPSVVRLSLEIFDNCYFASDCVPAAKTHPPGKIVSFGPLKIKEKNGACVLAHSEQNLAGGAIFTPQAFCHWVNSQPDGLNHYKKWIPTLTKNPIQSLILNPKEQKRLQNEVKNVRLFWKIKKQGTKHLLTLNVNRS